MARVLESAKYYIRAIYRNVKGGSSSNVSEKSNANLKLKLLPYKA